MSENRGVTPPNYASNVGRVRANIGDVTWEEYDPPQPGFGLYRMVSDAEIEAFLEQAGGSPEGAAYFVFVQAASAAALESRSVKDLDLQVDLTKRSGDLRAIAVLWKDRWDEAVGNSDVFEVFDTVTSGWHRCELSEGVFCCGR